MLALRLSTSPPASVRAADINPPPFDFSDQFYLANVHADVEVPTPKNAAPVY